MSFNRDRATAFVVALAVTVAVLVAGQLAWHKYAVAKPLDAGLREIPGVTAASWQEAKNGDVVINVTLGGVENLAVTHGDIETAAKNILGRRPSRIILTDTRTPELDDLYYAVHYHIQEAIAAGNFAAMAGQINTQAAARGVQAKIYVDARAVYLQLAKDGADLYAVVPREAPREVK